jgi:hypothetical protein
VGRLNDLSFRLSAQRTVAGFPVAVAVLLFSTREERETVFGKIAAALELVRRYAPVRFQQVLRDVRRILVFGDPPAIGSFDDRSGTCELWFDWVMSPETTPDALAGTIVHEAQHGRLSRLGFTYDAPVRGRIERICFRATRAFARRIPGGESIVAVEDAAMMRDNEFYSASAHFVRRAELVETFELPRPIKALFAALLRRRARGL